MSELTVSSTAQRRDDGRVVITTRLTGDQGELPEVWMALPPRARLDDLTPVDLGNVSLAVGMLTAMRQGTALRLEQPASRTLLASMPQYQTVFTTWYPELLQRVEVRAEAGVDERPRGAGEATFFTAGVDSFDTLLQNRATITALVYVAGFDVPLTRPDALDRTRRHLEAVAEAAQVELLEVESSIRTLFDAVGSWGLMMHGAALATVALALAPLGIGTVRIPSGKSYAQIDPWGSQPLIDPLWSTDAVSVVHDGADAPRTGKIARIAHEPLVHEHLRVCWEQFDMDNCGRCIKCSRTRLLFEAVDVGHLLRTFPGTISLESMLDEGFRGANDVFNARLVAAALQRNPRTRPYGDLLADRVRYVARRYPLHVGEALPPRDLRHRLALRLALRRARRLQQAHPLPDRAGTTG
ncbi:hypothetical protein [Microcella sp.]|uniref:hypothetical protein n=1 Tax=Microcella sp. TaxID=1913979 RepID=UPI00391951F8